MIELDIYFTEKIIQMLKGNMDYDKQHAIGVLKNLIDVEKTKTQFKHSSLNDAFIHEKKPMDYEEINNIARNYVAGNKLQ
jgi:hypothetical protein